jgi:oligopeptidase B
VDEFFWLRDDDRADPGVLGHLARENAWTRSQLEPFAALEQELLTELGARLPPADSSVPVEVRGAWYYYRYDPGAEHPVFARRCGSLDAPEEVLLDIEARSRGHAYYDVEGLEVSPDGRLLAFAEDDVGRRQHTLRVRDLATGEMLGDAVAGVEADFAWSADSRTIVYIEKDPQTLLSVRVRAHVLGSAGGAAADRLLYEERDPSYYLGVRASRSERFLFIDCASTEQTEVLACESADPLLRFAPLVPRADGHEYDAEHLGGSFLLRTNWQARNFRIVRAPLASCADRSTWVDVLAHREDTLVEHFEAGDHGLAVNERAGGELRIRLDPMDGRPSYLVEPPAPHCAMHIIDTPGVASTVLRYCATSLVLPDTTIDLDLVDGRQIVRKVREVAGFDAGRYRTRLAFAPARDGARIPVRIAWRADTALDGTAPLYQYGYGAYGLSMDADFRSTWVSLLDRGFVVAIAHVRGGQEMGRDWYDQGRLLAKRNSFLDFIDATAWLTASGFGEAGRVVACGGSAGGLLMGAVANLAPERYRAIVAYVPFVDIVTTMLDESIPLTTNEFDQWGDPKDPGHYANMLSYSPYDNVGPHAYPAMMVFSGLWDSQVQYWEPAKWVARLRERSTGSEPLLLHTDLDAGHGGKAGRYEHLRDTATEFAFLLGLLGLGARTGNP